MLGNKMKNNIADYNPRTAPLLMLPHLGHTRGIGVVSRNTAGITNARQLIARDLKELKEYILIFLNRLLKN